MIELNKLKIAVSCRCDNVRRVFCRRTPTCSARKSRQSLFEYKERKCADTIGTVLPCWFPGLAISNAIIQIFFSNKIYGNNFIKQHSETVMV